MSRDGEPWLTPIPADMPRREILARSIYRQRPFRTAMSGRVMDGFLSVAHEFDWDSAPEFYQRECFEALLMDEPGGHLRREVDG